MSLFNPTYLGRHLNRLQAKRRHFARFDTPTAKKMLAELDIEISQIEALLFPHQPTATPPTAPVFIHPRTGTIPNGF